MEWNLLGVIFSRLRNTRGKWLALLKPRFRRRKSETNAHGKRKQGN